jgi:hypothetical protein
MRAPAGVPPSGNAKYIVIAVLLIGGIAGLMALKTCGNSQPTAQGPAPVSTFDAAPLSHAADIVPPPPPPDEPVPDSGPGQRTVFYDPCTAKTCTGTTTTDLEQQIAFRAKTAHRCYDQALANDSDLKGHIGLKVRIGSNGAVCSVGVTNNDMGTDSVANCVANTFRAARSFPPAKGGACVELNVPISFVPGGK